MPNIELTAEGVRVMYSEIYQMFGADIIAGFTHVFYEMKDNRNGVLHIEVRTVAM